MYEKGPVKVFSEIKMVKGGQKVKEIKDRCETS